jgi:hypothetical protein
MFEEPFDFNRLKSSTSDITIIRAADAARRLQQEVPLPIEDEQDLPLFQLELSDGAPRQEPGGFRSVQLIAACPIVLIPSLLHTSALAVAKGIAVCTFVTSIFS